MTWQDEKTSVIGTKVSAFQNSYAMAGNDDATVVNKRVRNIRNYAIFSKRGYSTRATRVKKMLKQRKTSSAPTTPVRRQSKVGKNTSNKLKIKSSKGIKASKLKHKLLELKQGELDTQVQDRHDEGVNAVDSDNTNNSDSDPEISFVNVLKNKTRDKAREKDNEDNNLNSLHNVEALITDWTSRTNNMSLDERKRKLRQEIASLESELNQPDEDEELRDLLAKQELLKNQLAKKKGSTPVASSSNVGKSKSKTRGGSPDIFVKSFDEITKGKLPSLAEIQNELHIAEKKDAKRSKKSKRKMSRRKRSSSDETSSSSSDSESESESSDDEKSSKKRKGRKLKSGLHSKAGDARLVSNELYAQAGLGSEIGEGKDLKDLSFNLFVAGELEIITDPQTRSKEKESRLELLKMLAYKHEYLSRLEVLNQYKGFINRIERGKAKWGSHRDIKDFEHQLVFAISVSNSSKWEKSKVDKKNTNPKKFEDRKIYCLDFNRGECKFQKSHEGKINGQQVFKFHICKRCLVEDGVESEHMERNCHKGK